MARNLLNHIISAERVQQLKQANINGQLQPDDLHLLTRINEIIPSAAAPFNATNSNNKKAVDTFINHVEKSLQTE